MSRFLPDNHPKRGVCTLCQKTRLIVADLGIDAMIIVGTSGFLQSVQARHGVRPFTVRHGFCGRCYRSVMKDGQPQIHLATRGGIAKRLTRKQTEKAARKLARDLKKMQDES